MSNFDPKATFARNPDLVGTRVEDEVILMSLEEGNFFVISGPSADLWDGLKTQKSVKEIVDHLASIYDADKATIEAESEALFSDLLKTKIIQKADV